MALRVSGKSLDIGDALRTYVQTRINAATTKYFDGHVTGHVTIERDGSGYRTECTLHLSSGATLQVEAKAHEVYACYDQAAERLEKRLRRYKRRLKEHHLADTNGAAEATQVSSYVIEAPDEALDSPGEFAPVTIAETTTRLKKLSVSAAILELDLTGSPVIVFSHAGNGRVNVVYRRPDGNIGWIDPGSTSG
ncbi:MAG: ribosome-associated translation inhibitor RaiA [Methylobacteriaceae bacterium]|nr:ribosome-associated translation inhibitor RaiA [Methylobacteriaceae bacterium]MBV9245235.1 ribosome-associated translation inhibitor RaiA [Methylobacteriaceae bacterium]MBV9634619.1 ribosome-associated translation inhibitor RaiA [Methylobacteriaceae bacterium]MBV9703558.1 ribosome-associated translation inhibitor RaiA [Methylobacteriaceae bacterium]